MKILYLSKDYSPHDHRFLAALAKTDHDVFYLKLENNSRQIEDRPVPSRIEQVLWAGGRGSFQWRDLPRYALDLKRVVHRIRPDLIHAGPIQTCAFLAVLSGFQPILTMSWGFDLMQDADRNRWWRWITGYTLRHSTYFASDAVVTRDRAVERGMDPGRTVVFPWGVDLGHFNFRGRRPEKNRTAFTLFCNRSWEPRYGVDVLARAFVQVARLDPNVRLILLGGGSQAQELRRIFMNGGVLDRVQVGGQVSQSDLPRWYHMADLYISSSHVDGSSVSLMEALSCGLPVLVSEIPANKEWIRENDNGWLFPDGDAAALAEKIRWVISHRKGLAQIGRAARKTAEQRADWKRSVSVLLDTYERVVQLKTPRRSE